MKTLAEIQLTVEKEIDKLLWDKEPNGLYDPIAYILNMGGKRVRPALVLLATDMFEENTAYAIAPALALEMFHNFTLLHDDVMDKADVRRGKPTVHKKWSESVAILSGDQMLIEAYKMLGRTPQDKFVSIFNVFSGMATEICEGQQYDMDFEQRADVSVDEYINMIRLKTSVLLGTALKVGAIIANASERDQESVYDFGVNLGLAFQLKDDYLDVYGNPETFGKAIGGDILCNKKTYMLITAMQDAKGETKETLDRWLNERSSRKAKAKVAAVTQIYNELGVKEKCQELIAHYHNLAMENLQNITVLDENKKELTLLAQKLMHREE